MDPLISGGQPSFFPRKPPASLLGFTRTQRGRPNSYTRPWESNAYSGWDVYPFHTSSVSTHVNLIKRSSGRAQRPPKPASSYSDMVAGVCGYKPQVTPFPGVSMDLE